MNTNIRNIGDGLFKPKSFNGFYSFRIMLFCYFFLCLHSNYEKDTDTTLTKRGSYCTIHYMLSNRVVNPSSLSPRFYLREKRLESIKQCFYMVYLRDGCGVRPDFLFKN